MLLIKNSWNREDIQPFQDYLKSFSKGKEKSVWEKRIINTTLPCIAISHEKIKEIVNEISRGNFLEFINLWIWETHSNTIILGKLICKIKDFDLFEKYLLKYANLADNWATIDCLKFNVNEKNKEKFFNLAIKLIKDKKTFVRRLGFLILFNFINDENYLKQIFSILNSTNTETEYYVLMICSWLICECFIKQKQLTLKFFENNNLNKFVINKAISKCRDSFRVSNEDKDMLLKFKK